MGEMEAQFDWLVHLVDFFGYDFIAVVQISHMPIEEDKIGSNILEGWQILLISFLNQQK